MVRTLFGTAAALGLLVAPALAQDTNSAMGNQTQQTAASASSQSSSASDDQARQNATKSAEGIGMKNVAIVDRAFVLEGVNAAGNKVFMIVNPPGVLVGLGAPVETASASGAGTDNETTASVSDTDEPQPGEPAKSGYMATQAHPASPQMWDPEPVENSMQRLGLDKPAT